MIRLTPWTKGAKGGWEVDIRIEGPTGKRIRKRIKSPVASQSGSQRWAKALEQKLLQELLAPRARLAKKKPAVPTLKAFSPRWIREYAAANRQKPSGIAAKETILNIHLIPLIGAVPLDKIGAVHVAKIKSALQGKNPKTVNNILSTLHRLLEVAYEWGVMQSPPPSMPLLPYERPERDFWDFEELGKLVLAAKRTGWKEHLVVLLGSQAGLRCGEIMALTWGDVDLGRRRLTIRSSQWKTHLTETKGRKLRRVPMTADLETALKVHRHLRSERVVTQDDGQPLTQKVVRSIVQRVERAAGLRSLGVHTLRHTFCSHLAMKGVPARAIQELAGHKDLTTTMGYMHLSPAAVEGAIRTLESGTRWGELGETGLQPNVK